MIKHLMVVGGVLLLGACTTGRAMPPPPLQQEAIVVPPPQPPPPPMMLPPASPTTQYAYHSSPRRYHWRKRARTYQHRYYTRPSYVVRSHRRMIMRNGRLQSTVVRTPAVKVRPGPPPPP
jgi:hypothetical protein